MSRTPPAMPPAMPPTTPPAPADNLGPYVKARIAELNSQIAQARQDHADINQQIAGLKLARKDARAVIHQLQGRIAELEAIAANPASEGGQE